MLVKMIWMNPTHIVSHHLGILQNYIQRAVKFRFVNQIVVGGVLVGLSDGYVVVFVIL